MYCCSTPRRAWRPVFALLTCLLPAAAAAGIVPVFCDGTHVGNIESEIAAIGGVNARFVSVVGEPASLPAAAEICGEHHFNWYQVALGDNRPPLDAGGNRLSVPYVDPPPGGYSADPTQTPPFAALWADDLPWYFNEGPKRAGDPYHISDWTGTDTLFYEDLPNGPLGTRILFRTWLVSLNRDSSLHSFHGGFQWDFLIDFNGQRQVLSLIDLTSPPNEREYQQVVTGFATAIPLPPAVYLFASAAAVAACFRQRMRRSAID